MKLMTASTPTIFREINFSDPHNIRFNAFLSKAFLFFVSRKLKEFSNMTLNVVRCLDKNEILCNFSFHFLF
jgi:hypothetical protein